MKKVYRVYFSNDGTRPILKEECTNSNAPIMSKGVTNGQKTLSLKYGYHARFMVIEQPEK